jgi:nicotinate-nucleotide adenylyltransferase
MIKEIYYFGSFNPFHEGHKMVALCVSSYFYNCKVHITPSPCSPFKKKKDMLPIEDRIEIIKSMLDGCGILDMSMLDVSTIDAEVGNGKEQHYTYETLQVIKERANAGPKEIGFLFGSDVLAEFDKWKNWEWIYNNFTLVVYPREGDDIKKLLMKYPEVKCATVNLDMTFDYSSTRIREMFKDFDKYKPELKKLYNDKCLKILREYLI